METTFPILGSDDSHCMSNYFALHQSGTLLAACFTDGTVEVYKCHSDPIEGSEKHSERWELGCTLNDHVGPVFRCSWFPAQNSVPVLATVGADRGILLYSFSRGSGEGEAGASSGLLLQATRWATIRGNEKDVITAVAFVPPEQSDMCLLSTAALDGRVRLYKVTASLPLDRVAVWCPELGGSGGVGGASPGGVSALSWFPGRSEISMTVAVGCVSGKCYVARCTRAINFEPIELHPTPCCSSPVLDMQWGPVVGRRFQLLAVCSRNEVLIIRFNVISPALELGRSRIEGPSMDDHDGDDYASIEPVKVDIYRMSQIGACSLSWSRSASILSLVSDEGSGAAPSVFFLRMRDPSDHQSWDLIC